MTAPWGEVSYCDTACTAAAGTTALSTSSSKPANEFLADNLLEGKDCTQIAFFDLEVVFVKAIYKWADQRIRYNLLCRDTLLYGVFSKTDNA